MSFVASEWEKGGSQPKPSDGGESGSGQTAPSQGSDNWLSGLVSEEAEPAIDRDAGEGWLSGLVSEEAEPAVDRDAGDSWLSGLVKSDDQKVESKPKPVVQSPAPSGSSEPKAEVSAPTKIPDPKRVVEPPSPKQVSEMKPLVKPLAPTKSSKAKSPDSPGLDKEALKSAPKPTPMPGRPTAESRPVPKPVTPPEKPQPIPKPVTPAEKPQPSPALKSLSSGIPRELVSPLVSTSPPEPGPRTTNKLKERPLVPRVTPVDRKEKKPSQPIFKPGVSSRQLVTFYRSLSVMLSSGVPLFACFEFIFK